MALVMLWQGDWAAQGFESLPLVVVFSFNTHAPMFEQML
jgi:hypothetical protein